MSEIKCLFGYHSLKKDVTTGIYACKSCDFTYVVADIGSLESEDFPEIDERPYFKIPTDEKAGGEYIVVSNIKLSQKEVDILFDAWYVK